VPYYRRGSRAGWEVIRLSGEIAQVAAEIVPYVTTALGAYGGAVLAKVEDGAADATAGFGRRLLQRIFGRQKDGEPLPPVLTKVIANPGDPDYLGTLRVAIRDVLENDARMLAEVREILSEHREEKSLQAGRDLYFAQGNINIINTAPGHGVRAHDQAPGPVWGNIPPRNPGFAGREGILASVQNVLTSTARAAACVLHGMGGIGKTQIAIEYIYRFADEYDIIWWIDAERAGVIGEQFVALGAELGITPHSAQFAVAKQAVLASLRQAGKWLLVFDNAETPKDILQWLPGGNGHTLITSRFRAWDEIAIPAEVSVLERSESLDLLRTRVPGLSETDAGQLAQAVGNLPLAVVQAAGYMAASGTSATEYRDLLNGRAKDILDLGRPSSYPRSLVAVTRLGLEQLRVRDPSAANLTEICAFLAPEPIPSRWLSQVAAQLPGPLAIRMADPLARGEVLISVARSSLAEVSQDGLVMHRLTQAIIRELQGLEIASDACKFAEIILTSILPDDTRSPESWPEWSHIVPHLLALNPSISGRPGYKMLLSTRRGTSPDVASLSPVVTWLMNYISDGETDWAPTEIQR
jgi:hypothetical protein